MEKIDAEKIVTIELSLAVDSSKDIYILINFDGIINGMLFANNISDSLERIKDVLILDTINYPDEDSSVEEKQLIDTLKYLEN